MTQGVQLKSSVLPCGVCVPTWRVLASHVPSSPQQSGSHPVFCLPSLPTWRIQPRGVRGARPSGTPVCCLSADFPVVSPGEELIYLDPHTTQPAVELTDSCFIADESFHCRHPPSRMSIGELDPSIAVVRPRPSCLLGPWGRRSEPVRAQSCSSRMEGQVSASRMCFQCIGVGVTFTWLRGHRAQKG